LNFSKIRSRFCHEEANDRIVIRELTTTRSFSGTFRIVPARFASMLGLFAATVLLLASACATARNAKIPRAEAERIALTRVPNGVVKEAELEKEYGRLIWSFDIATLGLADITEVHVDANTGEVVATETEAHEKTEKKHEKQ